MNGTRTRHGTMFLCFLLLMGVGLANAAEETLTGRLEARFVDFDTESGKPGEVHHLLVDADGVETEIDLGSTSLAEHGGVQALLGETITVRGERSRGRVKVLGLETTLDADKRHPQPIAGSYPQVTILLRYSDDPSTPEPPSYFEFMYMSDTFPGTNHYVKEASYDIANLDGGLVVGWYDLPQPWAYYNWDWDENGWPDFDLDRALPHAIALADPDVYFPNYVCVNFVMNGALSCNDDVNCAWSKTSVLISADVGVPVSYGFTIMGEWGHDRMAVVPHETMHTWGLHHSGSYIGEPYDSHWDVMSGQGVNVDPGHPTYGHLTVYGISWHMLGMQWIPLARNWDTGVTRAGIIDIEHLEFPPLVSGTFAMATARILGGTNPFYTVEYRTLDGWDAEGPIPGQAVILHHVDVNLSDQQARVVDLDGDGDPNDESAMWRPGETFHDGGGQVIMHVEGWDATTATVSLSNRALSTVYVNLGAADPGYGTSVNPWNTVEEGYASVYRAGTVLIAPGIYGEGLRMTKPCTLMRNGVGGPVRIGG